MENQETQLSNQMRFYSESEVNTLLGDTTSTEEADVALPSDTVVMNTVSYLKKNLLLN